MPARNVNLTDHFQSFIEKNVESGVFSNASEVVREGLRLLEQKQTEEQAKIEWLRRTTDDALADFDRGEGILVNSVDDIKALVGGVLAEVRAARG